MTHKKKSFAFHIYHFYNNKIIFLPLIIIFVILQSAMSVLRIELNLSNIWIYFSTSFSIGILISTLHHYSHIIEDDSQFNYELITNGCSVVDIKISRILSVLATSFTVILITFTLDLILSAVLDDFTLGHAFGMFVQNNVMILLMYLLIYHVYKIKTSIINLILILFTFFSLFPSSSLIITYYAGNSNISDVKQRINDSTIDYYNYDLRTERLVKDVNNNGKYKIGNYLDFYGMIHNISGLIEYDQLPGYKDKTKDVTSQHNFSDKTINYGEKHFIIDTKFIDEELMSSLVKDSINTYVDDMNKLILNLQKSKIMYIDKDSKNKFIDLNNSQITSVLWMMFKDYNLNKNIIDSIISDTINPKYKIFVWTDKSFSAQQLNENEYDSVSISHISNVNTESGLPGFSSLKQYKNQQIFDNEFERYEDYFSKLQQYKKVNHAMFIASSLRRDLSVGDDDAYKILESFSGDNKIIREINLDNVYWNIIYKPFIRPWIVLISLIPIIIILWSLTLKKILTSNY